MRWGPSPSHSLPHHRRGGFETRPPRPGAGTLRQPYPSGPLPLPVTPITPIPQIITVGAGLIPALPGPAPAHYPILTITPVPLPLPVTPITPIPFLITVGAGLKPALPGPAPADYPILTITPVPLPLPITPITLIPQITVQTRALPPRQPRGGRKTAAGPDRRLTARAAPACKPPTRAATPAKKTPASRPYNLIHKRKTHNPALPSANPKYTTPTCPPSSPSPSKG